MVEDKCSGCIQGAMNNGEGYKRLHQCSLLKTDIRDAGHSKGITVGTMQPGESERVWQTWGLGVILEARAGMEKTRVHTACLKCPGLAFESFLGYLEDRRIFEGTRGQNALGMLEL